MRYLIVDEDPSRRAGWRTALGPQTDCDEAANGREAIALFRRARDNDEGYDAVLMDVTMPDMDGHETLQRFRHVEQEFGAYGDEGAKVLMFAPARLVRQLTSELDDPCVVCLAESSDADDWLAALDELGVAAVARAGCAAV